MSHRVNLVASCNDIFCTCNSQAAEIQGCFEVLSLNLGCSCSLGQLSLHCRGMNTASTGPSDNVGGT